MRRLARIALGTVLVLVVGIVMLYPFLWMVSGSFKSVGELLAIPPTVLPEHPTLDNYHVVGQQLPLLGRMYLNSLLVATSITVAQSIVCALAAFAFAKLYFRGRTVLFGLMMAALMVPVNLTIIPNFVTMRHLHLIDSQGSLILLGTFSAFAIFLLRQFFLTVPAELHDAAIIDGCNPWQSLWRVHLPLARPVLAVNAVLTFNAAWGDFFTPLIFLKSLNRMTLPLGISLIQGVYSQTSPAVMMATLTLSIVPVIAVFLIARRRLINSFVSSGIRG